MSGWGRGSGGVGDLPSLLTPAQFSTTSERPLLPFLVLCVLPIGTDPEETILHAFKVFDTEGKGFVKADL